MSMAFPIWPFLCSLLTQLTWAGPLSTASLTPYLASVIPFCAQSCLESFILEDFPTSVCGPPPNFSCLCTSDSTSGFTIGERSLECFAAACNDFEEAEAVSVYEVCTGILDAKPNTHNILTAVQTSLLSYTLGPDNPVKTTSKDSVRTFPSDSYTQHFTTTSSSTTLRRTTTTTLAASASSSHFTERQSRTTPLPLTSNPIPANPTTIHPSSATKAILAAASPSTSPRILSKSQIAGVTVAGVGAAAIAFGLCFLLLCCRRKVRTNRHSINSSSSFGGDKVVGSEDSSPDMAHIARTDFAYRRQSKDEQAPETVVTRSPPPRRKLRLETPNTSSEDGWDQYQRDMKTEFMGPQVPPKFGGDPSPTTPASNRTHSRLLPDKPSGSRYSLFPPPSRTPRDSIPGSSLRAPEKGSSTASHSPGSINTSQSGLQLERELRKPGSDPFLDQSSSSPPNIYPIVQTSRPKSPPARPQNQLYPAFRVPSWEQHTGVVRKPLPAHQSTGGRAVWPPAEAPRPSYHLPSHPPSNADGHRYTAYSCSAHKRNEPFRNTSNASTRFSNGSDTSIEEEPMPPTPKLRSPFKVKYPSVPVSAAESPTRRPKTAELPSGSEALANRRLGIQKAREIADRLEDPQTPSDGGPSSPRKSAKYQTVVSPDHYGIRDPVSPSSIRYVRRSPPMDPHW